MIDFNVNELRALQQLIHFAVQARGMEVAEASVVINSKIVAALNSQNLQNPQKPSTNTQPPLPPLGQPKTNGKGRTMAVDAK